MSIEIFKSCIFQPLTSNEDPASAVTSDGPGDWRIFSFYQDSTRRTAIPLRLQLQCPSDEILDQLLSTNCFDQFNQDSVNEENAESKKGVTYAENKESEHSTSELPSIAINDTPLNIFSFGIEAKVILTFGTGESIAAFVENVVILSAKKIQGSSSLLLETEISVIATRSEGGRIQSSAAPLVKANIEISAVFAEDLPAKSQTDSAAEGLNNLNLGGIGQPSRQERVKTSRLTPFELRVTMAHAMLVTAQSIPGPIMGQTFVSLTMSHSNMHEQTLTVTNISLHPGHSYEEPSLDTPASTSATDMSKSVKWSYAPKCAPGLPLHIAPYESFSTCLIVEATGDKRTRAFTSPISVTALVGYSAAGQIQTVLAAADTRWTTSRAAIEPADAFRVDLSVDCSEATVTVGCPVTINLDISNLSTESRQLMILVDNNSDVNLANDKQQVKMAAVSQKGGYKFGVWGLLDDGAAVIPSDADRELLSVDVALLVGEVKASSLTRAAVRFIALRQGTLNIPNFKLIDRRKGGKWYSAVHNLKIVAQAAS